MLNNFYLEGFSKFSTVPEKNQKNMEAMKLLPHQRQSGKKNYYLKPPQKHKNTGCKIVLKSKFDVCYNNVLPNSRPL